MRHGHGFKKIVTGNVTGTRKNGIVVIEMWRKHECSFATETRPVHGKLDHHVFAGRKRDGFKQLPVSVEFTKYGNTSFRSVFTIPRLRQFTAILRYPVCVNLQRFYGTPFASIYSDFTVPRLRQFTEILRYPVCVNLQRFYDAQFVLIYSSVIHVQLR